MSSRIGKRRRRVAVSESVLVSHRSALGRELETLAADLKTAATPGRIVLGGVALGAVVGLLTGGGKRKKAEKDSSGKPGTLKSLVSVVRLASWLVPMLSSFTGKAGAGEGDDESGAAEAEADAGDIDAGGPDPLP